MAKQPVSKGGTTKVRFVFLEAEGAEGDIAQIAAAIQTALGPKQTVIQQRLAPSPRASAALTDGTDPNGELVDFDDNDDDDESAGTAPAPRVVRDAKPRKYPTPQVLDIDLTSPMSFEEYANKKKPENEKDRFLVAATWFKEHRNEPAIGMSHVYTCYKKMRWPSAIADFSWPFRSLKKEGLMGSGGRGLYAINHIGTGRADEMGED